GGHEVERNSLAAPTARQRKRGFRPITRLYAKSLRASRIWEPPQQLPPAAAPQRQATSPGARVSRFGRGGRQTGDAIWLWLDLGNTVPQLLAHGTPAGRRGGSAWPGRPCRRPHQDLCRCPGWATTPLAAPSRPAIEHDLASTLSPPSSRPPRVWRRRTARRPPRPSITTCG